MSDLYNRIAELCKARGTNVTALCRKAKVARASLSELKMGRTKTLTLETAAKLADALGITVDELNGTNNPNPDNKKSPVYDDEALELMEEMHKRPELKALFSTSKKATREDIEAVDQLLKRMARGDADED